MMSGAVMETRSRLDWSCNLKTPSAKLCSRRRDKHNHGVLPNEDLPDQKCRRLRLEMHDEIFHFEIFKNFMKILKYFKTPF